MATPIDKVFNVADFKQPPPDPPVFRAYEASDFRFVQFIEGQHILNHITGANKAAVTSAPFLITTVLFSSLAYILASAFLPWWLVVDVRPFSDLGDWGYDDYISALSAFVRLASIVLVPVLVQVGLFEHVYRAYFEPVMFRSLAEEDISMLRTYYATSSLKEELATTVARDATGARKGFWVMEYDGRPVAHVALDGRKPGRILKSLDENETLSQEKTALEGSSAIPRPEALIALNQRRADYFASDPEPPTTDSSVAHIRRFAISPTLDFSPRPLLVEAVKYAFDPEAYSLLPPPDKVTIAIRSTVQKDWARILKDLGFTRVPAGSELVVKEVPVTVTGFLGALFRFYRVNPKLDTYVLTKETFDHLGLQHD